MITFPKDFTWGVATSSYQIEGAWLEGGKGLSIWDAWSHLPGKIAEGHTGDIACDHFHRYREDIALMADMGVQAYRLSLAWTRIQPNGYGPHNPEGIRFYSDLIDELLRHGITPWVTLYHWDLPLALEMERSGWLDPGIAATFRDYAGICFAHFGDRVKNWITFNEAWVISLAGYNNGNFPPGRKSAAEPYLAAHNILRSHALAVELYRTRYGGQKGRIGMTNNCDWREPATSDPKDHAAAQRAVEFFLGWFGDPLYRGDYPDSMRAAAGSRLPHFNERERELLRGSSDFFGLNHYTTHYVRDASGSAAGTGGGISAGAALESPAPLPGPEKDQRTLLSLDCAWERNALGWAIVPWGLNRLLHWIDQRYGRPEIIITENGIALDDRLVDGTVEDPRRIDYYRAYLTECHRVIAAGVNLKGYFAWSFMDNFEWTAGYSKRFGLHYVDFASGRRIPKSSAGWFSRVMADNGF